MNAIVTISMPAAIIATTLGILEIVRKRKADRLLERASRLINTFSDRPIDLLATKAGQRFLTASSTLNHIEDKIRFIERSKEGRSSFDFHKQLRPFDQRFDELEKRTSRLEQII